MTFLSLVELEIRKDHRQHQILQFVILQYFHKNAIELTKFLTNALSATRRAIPPGFGNERISRRDEQMGRLVPILATQATPL
jgi:hypothetical protein